MMMLSDRMLTYLKKFLLALSLEITNVSKFAFCFTICVLQLGLHMRRIYHGSWVSHRSIIESVSQIIILPFPLKMVKFWFLRSGHRLHLDLHTILARRRRILEHPSWSKNGRSREGTWGKRGRERMGGGFCKMGELDAPILEHFNGGDSTCGYMKTAFFIVLY